MSTQTSFLGLTKPAGNETYSVDVTNNNLDKIDTAASKTNKKLPYCSTLAALQTAILAAVGELSNGEIACGYCDIGFADGTKGIDGTKGSYLLLRQSADVFSIHIFSGSSETMAYYYSSTWHWKPSTPVVLIANQTSDQRVFLEQIKGIYHLHYERYSTVANGTQVTTIPSDYAPLTSAIGKCWFMQSSGYAVVRCTVGTSGAVILSADTYNENLAGVFDVYWEKN